jgi:hypothetical protein
MDDSAAPAVQHVPDAIASPVRDPPISASGVHESKSMDDDEGIELGFAQELLDSGNCFMQQDWTAWDGGKLGGRPASFSCIASTVYCFLLLCNFCRYGLIQIVCPLPPCFNANYAANPWQCWRNYILLWMNTKLAIVKHFTACFMCLSVQQSPA